MACNCKEVDPRRSLLSVEHWAREESGKWENKYIKLHLDEVRLAAMSALVQLDYAELAKQDPTRGGKTRCWICTEDVTTCHCVE